MSQITKTKRSGHSDSIYLSSYSRSGLTQVVPKRPLHHHCAVNCLACYQLVPCSLVWHLYKPKCETKPIQYMSCLPQQARQKWANKIVLKVSERNIRLGKLTCIQRLQKIIESIVLLEIIVQMLPGQQKETSRN